MNFLRKSLFTLIFLLPMLALAADPVGAKLELASTHYDLTQVKQGEPVSVTIEFKNTGDQPLEISKIKTPCGCTTTQLEKQTFARGESGSFTVSINTSRIKDTYDKTLRILSNDPAQPEAQVRITFPVENQTLAKN